LRVGSWTIFQFQELKLEDRPIGYLPMSYQPMDDDSLTDITAMIHLSWFLPEVSRVACVRGRPLISAGSWG